LVCGIPCLLSDGLLGDGFLVDELAIEALWGH
jgi:hypothetical protein